MTHMFKDHTGNEHDFDTLPISTKNGLLGRAMSHIMGNEVASQVVGKIRATIAEKIGVGKKAADVATADVQAFRSDPANAEALKAWTAEFQTAKLKAILEGTLGVHVGGSAVDPLTRTMLSIARTEIKALFKKQGWTFPTGEDVFKMGEASFTNDELVDRWLNGEDKAGTFGKPGEANEPRIKRLAERTLRDKANAAKAVANADTTGLAASLGL